MLLPATPRVQNNENAQICATLAGMNRARQTRLSVSPLFILAVYRDMFLLLYNGYFYCEREAEKPSGTEVAPIRPFIVPAARYSACEIAWHR